MSASTCAVRHYYTPEMEEARSRVKLRPNAFVRLQKQFENGRPVLDIMDFGDAERLLKDKHSLARKAKECANNGGSGRANNWAGWLGRYQSALDQATDELSKITLKSDRGR